MSGIELQPVDGGSRVEVPKDKISIGRGSFLQVTDKKVSRNHATIEVNSKGEMVLVPIHTNPCFFKAGGKGDKTILTKDKPKVLQHSDVFGLLPDKLYFKVVYVDSASETDENDEADIATGSQPWKLKMQRSKKEMALPLDRKRKLPKWMVGSAKRTTVTEKQATLAKTVATTKARAATNANQSKARAAPPKKKPRRRKVSDDDDDDDYEEAKKPARRTRTASLKKPKYTDDFVVSGEELDLSSEEEEEVSADDQDSDFSVNDVDSGSDWGASNVKGKKRTPSKSTPSRRGRGRPRGSASSGRKRRRGSDSDFLDDSEDEDYDSYVPRPSKRRAAGRRKKKQETDSEEEESDYSEEEVKPKKKKVPTETLR